MEKSQNAKLINELYDFISRYFNLNEVRDLCFKLGIIYDDLPGDTLNRKARGLVIKVGKSESGEVCQRRYRELLSRLKSECVAFYPNLFDNLDTAGLDEESREQALAEAYCAGRDEFEKATRSLVETTLSRLGIEQRLGIALIIIFLLVIMVSAFLLYRQVRPSQMQGDFNIAVAPFIVEGAEQAVGEDVANSIFGRLRANFEDQVVPIVDVWGPAEPALNQVPVVKGDSENEQDSNAARLADRINADIVVYGSVVKEGSHWEVMPKFYVSPNNFENASEILGPYDLGEIFGLAEANRRALRITAGDALTKRVKILTQVAIALTYYSIANYDRASVELMAVLADESVDPLAGEESVRLVYLLLGNTFLNMARREILALATGDGDAADAAQGRIEQQTEEARSFFEQSFTIDPQYARALLGLADTTYVQSWECDAGRCETDVELLRKAADFYERALVAQNAPKTAVIDAKAHYGLGQVLLNQSVKNIDGDFATAIDQFELVVDEYAAGDVPRARDIAAEAHARLGLIYCYQGRFDEAVDEYEAAIQLHGQDRLQGRNRLLPLEVREQRIATFENRISALVNTDAPSCAGNL